MITLIFAFPSLCWLLFEPKYQRVWEFLFPFLQPQCSFKKNQKEHFIEGWLTYKEQYIFNLYNWKSMEIIIHPCNYHHNLCHKHIHHLQKFPPVPLLLLSLLLCGHNNKWWSQSHFSCLPTGSSRPLFLIMFLHISLSFRAGPKVMENSGVN